MSQMETSRHNEFLGHPGRGLSKNENPNLAISPLGTVCRKDILIELLDYFKIIILRSCSHMNACT